MKTVGESWASGTPLAKASGCPPNQVNPNGEELQERLSGLAEQMTVGIEERHEGIAKASDKGKPTLRRILATHQAVLDGVRKARGAA